MVHLFVWLVATLIGFFAAHYRYMDYFVAFCIFITGFVFESFVFVGQQIIKCFQYIVGSFSEAGQAPCANAVAGAVQLANTFFPVDEVLRYTAVLILAVWIPIGLYRLVKSWIPTLAGG